MKTRICLFLIGCLIHGGVIAACRDIAVLSGDARYMVLDSRTLEIRDVGNLWWLGIRQLNFVGGNSTLDSAWIQPEIFLDPSTGERLNTVLEDDGYFRPTVDRYFLENFGSNYRTQTDIPTINYEEQGITLEWATYRSTRVVRSQGEIFQFVLSGHQFNNVENNKFTVMDSSFNIIVDGTVGSSADSAICKVGSRIYVAGGREAWSFDSTTGQVDYANWPDRNYVITRIQDGCRALARPRGDAVNPDSDWRLIDFSTGEILSRFDLDFGTGRHYLFDNGSRWLIQGGRGDENNVLQLTSEFVLVDTITGEILVRTEPDINGAELPHIGQPRRFCESGGDEERVVALRRSIGEDTGTTLYLIDARTLTVLNSITLPFQEHVWAF